MPHIAVHDLKLFYETVGQPSDPAIVLVAGLGVQMIDWPDYFVDALVSAGHYVVMYDNRDIGLSTTFDGAPDDPQAVMAAVLQGQEPQVAYTLVDMAADVAGLLDALDIDAAHLVGVSMGGMIVQAAAINHPEKVLSFTSIMSSTGNPEVGQPTEEAMAAILAPALSPNRDEAIAHSMVNAQVWASPGRFDEIRMRKLFEDAWDRVDGPQGANAGRHFCAIMASGPRDESLAILDVPTLVVHGTADTLIQSSGGTHTASLVPGAELLLIDGMGHDIVADFAPQIASAITRLVASTGAESS